MFYTLEQLKTRLKRSKNFVELCVCRFDIKKVRLKTTNQLVYDIPKEKMELIEDFNVSRKRIKNAHRNNKPDK